MRPESWDATLARSAERRYGVIARAEALAAGASSSAIARRVRSGRWRTLHPGIYAITGSPPSWRQALLAACLSSGTGSAASHCAAALLWRLASFADEVIEVSVRRPVSAAKPFVVHRVTWLPSTDITRVDAIPVTTVARTLLDLAGTQPEERVEAALDDAIRRRLVTVRRYVRYLESIARSGRPGLTVMRTLLAARPAGPRGAESPLETALVRALRRHGLPRPVLQYELRLRNRRMRVDVAYPRERLAIEAEGYRYHGGRQTWESDLERRNLLTEAGWRIAHVTWNDLRDRETETVKRIRQLLAASILS